MGLGSLPSCAQRMLAEGVTEQQRVACFRLAVHLDRIDVPEDLARVLPEAWSNKNRPTGGKRVITTDEIANQTCDGYSGRYRGYGCDDPSIAQYCEGRCPVLKKQQSKTMPHSATLSAKCTLGSLHDRREALHGRISSQTDCSGARRFPVAALPRNMAAGNQTG